MDCESECGLVQVFMCLGARMCLYGMRTTGMLSVKAQDVTAGLFERDPGCE